ncbi:zinc finger BED domain-containing protein 6-like [Topomyia yanbarensis]|uniref:zinc finger BED domain-containing protein 6-like n=1 Tax=Topomyia yanbarensis TaxID=2498891 RepID=UPI00273CB643|nr:zinc finger BED domain-containing protein 6-like [Topomyia yanbarensis]
MVPPSASKSKISPAWAYFDKIEDNKVRCKLCNLSISYCRNTTNMLNHLKNKHKSLSLHTRLAHPDATTATNVDDENGKDGAIASGTDSDSEIERSDCQKAAIIRKQQLQPSIVEAISRPLAFAADGPRGMQVTNALIYYITKDNLSLNAVDKPGFRRFIKTVCPLYNCPLETQFTKLIHNKYETLKETIRNRLHSTGSICLTTDIWTEMMNVKSYSRITGHFIHDFQLMSCLLGVIKCDQSKTGAYIADLLLDCCNGWDIELDNVSCVVTDNGANIVNAVKLQFGEKRHLPCFAHTLNLIASKSVPLYNEAYGACLDPVIDSDDEDVDESDIDDAKHNSPEENMIIFIKKMKRIIKFFKKSETAMRELRKLQVIDGKKEGQCLMLILDVKTRWNSIMAMIVLTDSWIRVESIAHNS